MRKSKKNTVSSVLETIYEDLLEDLNSYDERTIFNESAIVVSKGTVKYYPVFIFLSFTGTGMAKLIQGFTHDPYSHSSLSFDTDLTHMKSFNRDGFVTENIRDKFWSQNADHIKYSLYMYLAKEDEYRAMRNFVAELDAKKSKLKYSIIGLTNFIFGHGDPKEDRFFCSEFVAACIEAGNKSAINSKPCMTSPYMLAKNKNFIFIRRGILKHYKFDQIDTIVTQKLAQQGFSDFVLQSVADDSGDVVENIVEDINFFH